MAISDVTADITIGGLSAYDLESQHGIVFSSYVTRGMQDQPRADIEVDHTDIAFALCAIIDRYGLANVRACIDRIARDDPTGQRVGLSAPAKILQGIDPRKAG